MNREEFSRFLKRGGRAPRAVDRCLRLVQQFEDYMGEQREGKTLDTARPQDLEAFVAWIERPTKASAKTHLWAIRYYYAYTSNEELHHLAGALREQRIERKPFALKDFRGVNPEYAAALATAGIRNVKQMLDAGKSPASRQALAKETGVPLDAILEFVKLSDLARIPGIKGIRARLYHDAGIDTVEIMATWDPEELVAYIGEFVEHTGFDGLATLPAEARFSVERARTLSQVVEY